MICIHCTKKLVGKQTKYCSIKCRDATLNAIHQKYSNQKIKGKNSKLKLLIEHGGGCKNCGYNKNLAAIDFHHIDPTTKKFNVDSRTLSNMNQEKIREEANKCIPLCRNCHAEYHHPDYAIL